MHKASGTWGILISITHKSKYSEQIFGKGTILNSYVIIAPINSESPGYFAENLLFFYCKKNPSPLYPKIIAFLYINKKLEMKMT